MAKVLQKSQLLCLIFDHKFEGTFPFLGMICSPPGGKDLNFFQNLSGQNLSASRIQICHRKDFKLQFLNTVMYIVHAG